MRILLAALLLGFAGAGLAEPAKVRPGSHVNLRAGKTEAYRVLRVLPPESRVEILERDGAVARVRTESGETGWLPLRLIVPETPKVEPPPPPPPAPSAAAPLAPPPAAAPALVTAPSFPWTLLGVGALGFLLGAAVGIGLHEAYYRKRLNGLRI